MGESVEEKNIRRRSSWTHFGFLHSVDKASEVATSPGLIIFLMETEAQNSPPSPPPTSTRSPAAVELDFNGVHCRTTEADGPVTCECTGLSSADPRHANKDNLHQEAKTTPRVPLRGGGAVLAKGANAPLASAATLVNMKRGRGRGILETWLLVTLI